MYESSHVKLHFLPIQFTNFSKFGICGPLWAEEILRNSATDNIWKFSKIFQHKFNSLNSENRASLSFNCVILVEKKMPHS